MKRVIHFITISCIVLAAGFAATENSADEIREYDLNKAKNYIPTAESKEILARETEEIQLLNKTKVNSQSINIEAEIDANRRVIEEAQLKENAQLNNQNQIFLFPVTIDLVVLILKEIELN